MPPAVAKMDVEDLLRTTLRYPRVKKVYRNTSPFTHKSRDCFLGTVGTSIFHARLGMCVTTHAWADPLI